MKIPPELRRVSALEYKTFLTRLSKLTEEVGELAAEINCYIGEKPAKGRSQEEILNALRLEAVDVIIMGMDILARAETSDEQIVSIMGLQLEKWENWIKKKNQV